LPEPPYVQYMCYSDTITGNGVNENAPFLRPNDCGLQTAETKPPLKEVTLASICAVHAYRLEIKSKRVDSSYDDTVS